MKISVQSAARPRHQLMIDTLQGSDQYKYQYLGVDKLNPISLNFEVDSEDEKAVVMATEKLLKNVLGKGVQFRVVPYGKVVYYH